MIKPRTLPGFLELLPQQQIIFNKMKSTVENVFLQNSFLPVETPVLEYSEVLLAKNGGETEKQVYRFVRGDTDMCMRFDQTVPLAKYVAANSNNLIFPFRRYAIGKVFRGERAQKGRFREFYQCDVDIIGDGTLDILADGEVIAVLAKIYKALGFNKFTIRANHRKILNEFFAHIGVSEQANDILRIVDKYYKTDEQTIFNLICEITNSKIAQQVLDFVKLQEENVFALCQRLRGLEFGDAFQDAVNEFENIVRYAISFGLDEKNICFDLKTVRGLDYYTGVVFECYLDDYPQFGSVGGGGRYENLTTSYSDKKMPGVGFGFGLTRLFSVLRENGMLDNMSQSLASLAIIAFDETTTKAAELCQKARSMGINCQLLYGPKNIKSKFALANKMCAKFAVVVGENEIASGQFMLKDMQSGSSEMMSFEKLVDVVLKKEKYE